MGCRCSIVGCVLMLFSMADFNPMEVVIKSLKVDRNSVPWRTCFLQRSANFIGQPPFSFLLNATVSRPLHCTLADLLTVVAERGIGLIQLHFHPEQAGQHRV